MKRIIVFTGIFTAVISILIYQVTNPLQSEIVINNVSNMNASISFDLTEKSVVKLSKYDLSGQELSSEFKELQAGLNQVFLNDESGNCYYKLTSDKFININKINLTDSSKEILSYK